MPMQGFCPLLFPVNGFIDSLSAEYQFGSIATFKGEFHTNYVYIVIQGCISLYMLSLTDDFHFLHCYNVYCN